MVRDIMISDMMCVVAFCGAMASGGTWYVLLGDTEESSFVLYSPYPSAPLLASCLLADYVILSRSMISLQSARTVYGSPEVRRVIDSEMSSHTDHCRGYASIFTSFLCFDCPIVYISLRCIMDRALKTFFFICF